MSDRDARASRRRSDVEVLPSLSDCPLTWIEAMQTGGTHRVKGAPDGKRASSTPNGREMSGESRRLFADQRPLVDPVRLDPGAAHRLHAPIHRRIAFQDPAHL